MSSSRDIKCFFPKVRWLIYAVEYMGEFEGYRAISRDLYSAQTPSHRTSTSSSQEPVDSTDANIMETSTCLVTTQQETPNFTVRLLIESDWYMFSCSPECSKQLYHYENTVWIGGVLGHRIDAKISPKAASEKAQTTVSENRYTSPKIDVFRTAILTLLAPTGNNARASFLVH